MPRSHLTPVELQELHDLAAQWGNIIARRSGDEALQFDLNTMEQIAQAAAAGLTQGTIECLLQRQAEALEPTHPCPACERVCPVTSEDRTLHAQAGVPLNYHEPVCHCPDCRRDFFPLRIRLGLDERGYSPAVLQLVVTAAARLGSFADAAFAVGLAGVTISARHVQELTGEVGRDLARQRDERAEQRRRRTLQPSVKNTPKVVAVEVDGGRMRTRATESGRGVHDAQNKENKIACLVTLDSDERADDPQPQPPATFLQPRRVQRLVQQMAGQAGSGGRDRNETEADPSAEADSTRPCGGRLKEEGWAPKRRVRTCVASMAESHSFGPMMAGEAQARDFYEAPRRAFVADGAAYNWSIQEGYFPSFEPIVDFLHVLCYLYKAAYALGPDEGSRWSRYVGWLTSCWEGRVSTVLEELRVHQASVGCPPDAEELPASEVRVLVAEALSYLGNNAKRMDYPRYRRLGLPTTSSLVESLVGEFNARVKSKQKHWNRPEGAEAILQVRAAYLSEDGRFERYFIERPGCPYRRRAA